MLVALIDRGRFFEIAEFAIRAFAGTLPYIAGRGAADRLAERHRARKAWSAKAFQGRENRMILLAALFGGLAPFCSCEVIPFIAGLLAVGAPLPR